MSRLTDAIAAERRALASRESAAVATLHRQHLATLDALQRDPHGSYPQPERVYL